MKGPEKEEKIEAELLLPRERRDYPRISVSVKVKYRMLDDDADDRNLVKHFDPEKIFFESSAVNISASGLLMKTKEEIPLKKFIAISMYLPMPGISCNCRAIAEIVRCEKDREIYLIGVKFLKVINHSLNKFKFLSLADLLNMKGDSIKID
ncbi:MAG TPA: PilZ domain-containing protein [bacterium]|nr:PilZ domain-containing protein [bacterium]